MLVVWWCFVCGDEIGYYDVLMLIMLYIWKWSGGKENLK